MNAKIKNKKNKIGMNDLVIEFNLFKEISSII
jgi:hypothetical protein